MAEQQATAYPDHKAIANMQFQLAGRSKDNLRAKDDFYPTPEWVGEILIKHHHFNGKIWECACGDGALAKQLSAAGYDVISTDLINRGYGTSGIDFLLESTAIAENIVTNPPFNLAYEFMEHGLSLGQSLALLLPIRYLAGLKRSKLYKTNPPCKIVIIPKKIDFLGIGKPVMEFAWFIWDKTYSGSTYVIWA